MGVFQYKGRQRGEAVAGRLEAATPDTAATRLLDQGITPVEISPAAGGEDMLAGVRQWLSRRKVGDDDLVMFSRQMHTMTRAGVPILRGLRGIAQITHAPRLAEVLNEVADSLESGHTLRSSMQRSPDVFPRLFVNTIHMGEEAGRLEEAFDQLATHLEADRETRRRIKAAIRYPTMVVGAVVAAMVVLNLFALPVFADIFAEFGADLPWPTRVLIASSQFSTRYWPHLTFCTLLLVFGVRSWVNTPPGRLFWDRSKFRIPVVGSIIEKATLARFARTFALSIRSGVPLIQGIDIAGGVVDNDYVASNLKEAAARLERGETLTRTAAASGLFTPLVLQMFAVGEETGSLDDLMQEVAEFYERDVDYELKRISEALEPILLVGVGLLVLMLALGVYLPMWDLAGAARGG